MGGAHDFFSVTSLTVDQDDQPHMVVNPRNRPGTFTTYYDKANNRWAIPEQLPYAANTLMIDSGGTHWAFAKGLKVLIRHPKTGNSWKEVFSEQGFCYPKPLEARETNGVFIHTQSCDLRTVKILWLHQ